MPDAPLDHEDFSFLMLRMAFIREKRPLIDRDTALRLADGVLWHHHGDEIHRLNMPLSIAEAETGDAWVVTGAAPTVGWDALCEDVGRAHRFEIHIDKYNARITRMVLV